jgi:putative PIN family toxin of toxin-antitoxin system
MSKLKLVLDTNILLISLPTKSKYRPIFDSLVNNKFQLMITNEILSEYLEIIQQKTTSEIANNVIKLLLSLKNVIKAEVYYKWHLIEIDQDDNKFVDCAISSNADFIVTNDQHFKILEKIKFPKINVIEVDDLIQKLK